MPRRFSPLPIVLGLSLFTASALNAQERPAITPEDYGKWEQLGSGTLSPNGAWLAYPISRVNGENELRIRHIGTDSIIVAPFGSRATFSDDGR